MTAYYNENNPKAAAMLRELIEAGLIAPGYVDERSIKDVKADDLEGYTQCHFFAGIGGWSVALRLAGWTDDRPVWTGSCPCQPFSTAGRQKGKADDRHLWPDWFRLIRECRPAAIFGEQVGSAIAHGWWDDVANDLERQDYAVGAAVLPACSVGAPHQRQRLWFVAKSELRRCERQPEQHTARIFCSMDGSTKPRKPARAHSASTLGNSQHDGSSAATFTGSDGTAIQRHAQGQDSTSQSVGTGAAKHVAERQWDYANDIEWIECPDGKSRPVKSGLRLVVNGFPHRAPILHGFGNAIVPHVAAAFIEASRGENKC